MTDQTGPITDDDRLAHEWADHQLSLDVNDEVIVTAARAIKSHVPAPPKSLADELRELADDTVASGMFGSMTSRLTRLADRAAAFGKELAATYSENERVHSTLATVTDERNTARDERDAARAEVAAWMDANQALTGQHTATVAALDEARAEVERLTDVPPGMYELDRTEPPTSADDVPEYKMWLIDTDDNKGLTGVRDEHGRWSVMSVYGYARECALEDEQVTPVARLVPDTRRVIDKAEDLDSMPVMSVVLADGKPAVKHVRDRWWIGGVYASASDLVTYYGTVSVLHVPEVTA
jgi:hypothetical protein